MVSSACCVASSARSMSRRILCATAWSRSPHGDGEAREGLLVTVLRPDHEFGIHVPFRASADAVSARSTGMGGDSPRRLNVRGRRGHIIVCHGHDRAAAGPRIPSTLGLRRPGAPSRGVDRACHRRNEDDDGRAARRAEARRRYPRAGRSRDHDRLVGSAGRARRDGRVSGEAPRRRRRPARDRRGRGLGERRGVPGRPRAVLERLHRRPSRRGWAIRRSRSATTR